MISIWPHFAADSRYYDLFKTNDWFIQKADGSPDVSWWGKSLGPDIDATDPEAAKRFWGAIRDNHIKHEGFDYIWLDETEPDIDTYSDFFHIGAATATTTSILCSIRRRSTMDSAGTLGTVGGP